MGLLGWALSPTWATEPESPFEPTVEQVVRELEEVRAQKAKLIQREQELVKRAGEMLGRLKERVESNPLISTGAPLITGK